MLAHLLGIYGCVFVQGVSKTAVIGLAKAFASELGGDGVRVNVVSPGVVKTNFSKMIWQDTNVADLVSSQTMLGRLGLPEDVAGVGEGLTN